MTIEVVQWWDDVAGHARLITDIEKMNQGRAAEKLSIDFECERLNGLGITKKPEWMGLDDNYAGYDILSYDIDAHGLVNKMIEVKSTIASPLRFYISRNEWKQALAVGDAYIFHVWDMAKPSPILHVRTVEEVSPHIPEDQENGKWTVAEIPIAI